MRKRRVGYLLFLTTGSYAGSYLFDLLQRPEDKLVFIIVSLALILTLAIIGMINFVKKVVLRDHESNFRYDQPTSSAKT